MLARLKSSTESVALLPLSVHGKKLLVFKNMIYDKMFIEKESGYRKVQLIHISAL
jgi:hypothetical protein